MHVTCLLDAIVNPCPLCHGILYNLSEASKYAYCKHNINKNQCMSIAHIDGERRIQYTSDDGKTVYTAENLVEKCGIQTI